MNNTVTTRILTAELPVREYVENYVDIPKFAKLCEVCPNYGRRWSCPPYDFSVPGLWERYGQIRLMAMQIIPETREEKERAAREPRDFLAPYRASLESALAAREKEQPRSLRLNPGSCVGCVKCAREDGQPCRREDMCRCSVESLGSDVGKVAAELLHTPLVWGQNGEAPAYFLLVGAILTE